mgnify:CR=1 FL=1
MLEAWDGQYSNQLIVTAYHLNISEGKKKQNMFFSTDIRTRHISKKTNAKPMFFPYFKKCNTSSMYKFQLNK